MYQLRIRLAQEAVFRAGALGEVRLPRGWYVYTGSARAGLASRVRRHLDRSGRRGHWHIDALVDVAGGVEAFVWPGDEVGECELHARLSGGGVVVPGFGSSDCRCRSHLAYFRRRPKLEGMSWARFVRRFDSAGADG